MARCFDADHFDILVVKEGVEQADGVGAAAYRRHQHIGQAAFGFEDLLARFLADHRLEIAHQFRIGVGASGRAMM